MTPLERDRISRRKERMKGPCQSSSVRLSFLLHGQNSICCILQSFPFILPLSSSARWLKKGRDAKKRPARLLRLRNLSIYIPSNWIVKVANLLLLYFCLRCVSRRRREGTEALNSVSAGCVLAALLSLFLFPSIFKDFSCSEGEE